MTDGAGGRSTPDAASPRPRRRRATRSALLLLVVVVAVVAIAFLASRQGRHAGPSGQAGASGEPATSGEAGASGSIGQGATGTPRSSRKLTTPLLTPPPGSDTRVPGFRHVWLVVMENKTYDQIVGKPDAAFLNELIATGGLATKFQAVAHPSQPNYLALFSGSLQGISDDKPHDLTAPTIADQLEAAHKTWHVYAENVPPGCSQAPTATNGPDGSGKYARKHEPAISFTSISGDPARCANIVDFSGFDPAAAEFELIVPNLCHDMHDCSVAVGDDWLRGFLPRITDSAAYRDNGVLVVTWDEGADGTNPPNRIATIVSGPLVTPGTRSDVPHSHYSLLRTIQDGFGLDCLAESCSANTLGELFAGAAPSPSG